MPSMKSVKNRIKSVENTRQITKAMELVAAGKLKKAKERAERTRPFFTSLYAALSDIAKNNHDFSSPFVREADEKSTVCHIVIAGDRGLAGGYNANLFKTVNAKRGDIVFPIGKKAAERFSGGEYDIFTTEYTVASEVSVSDCYAMGKSMAKAFLNGKIGALKIYYTCFENVLTQSPAQKSVLPITCRTENTGGKNLTLYDPSPEAVFEKIVPSYIAGIIYGALCESLASELSARRNAMESATDNADEIINELSRQYNRARQAAITQELTEIVAGS